MENIGGGLGFKATLNIDDFNVSAQAMERQIRNFSETAAQEVAAVEDSFQQMAQKAGQYISYYLIGQGMNNLVSSIVSVRGQFQQLELAFGTMLGSTAKATDLMQQMVDTAAKTPFDLMGVAEGAKQLLAYGVSADKVNDTLVRLGNIASGLSIPLNDIVYLYGTTMVQGRLYAQDVRQFTGRGIPLVKELAEKYGVTAEKINEMVSAGKIGFPDVEEVINKMTNAGGQFYQLMEKQSSSLTGQIANLEDAWDSALNSFGEQTEGVLSAGIQSATYVVEHMDDVVRILESIAIAYGSVKAATILASVATKGYTGITVLDNAAKTAQLALMKAQMALSGEAISQKKAMTAAEQANYAALATTLTAEETAAVTKRMRIAAIQSLLTTQQQEYLSNLNLTASSQGYEAAAVGVMTAEQRLALSKQDLTAKSAAYRAAIVQVAQAKAANQAQTVETMRSDVRAAAQSVETAKAKAIAATQATEAARHEVYWAQKSGNATAIASAQKKLDAAMDTQSATRKAALAAQTDFYTRKKQLEAAATLQARTASIADTGAKTAQSVATNILSAATTKLTAGIKALWATMKANPLSWILSLVGLVASAFTLFSKTGEEAADAMGEFQEATRKQMDNLELLFTVLQETERGTKSHKDVTEKINAICKEYNKTLLEENSTLAQQKEKYEELTKAVQETTAEKIKAKYVEKALQSATDAHENELSRLKKDASKATHKEFAGYQQTYNARGSSGQTSTYRTVASSSIRNASEALWDIVESDVADAVKSLDGLTGQAYKDAYEQILNNITKAVRRGSKASGAEINAFKPKLKEYLDSYIETANKAQKEIAKVGDAMSAHLAAPKDTTNVDIAKLSLEELHKLADSLNGKKVTIDFRTYGFDTARSMLQAVNKEMDKQQNELNTESGISAEITKLKELKGQVELYSQAWKDYDSQLTRLQTRLDNVSGSKDAQRNADSLKQKQLEVDNRIEEARIATMKEGYEKRKAQLDLQHKQTLQQIDKEEKELAEARKKAGKGGLTADEKAKFQEMRNFENTSYTQSQNKLFDGELAYKKQQYELYFRWVKNMGEDVANKQFKDLLKSGKSFKSYIEQQIAALTVDNGEPLSDRLGRSGLNEGEVNMLNELKTQYNEITGVKSAMDAFKESISGAIQNAATLAERLQVLADARDKLANGGSGLVSDDEKAAASLLISEKQAEVEKELQNTILNDFKDYEERKNEIIANYDAMRLNQLAQNNAELLARINQGEADALSALDAEKLKASADWKALFTNLDVLTASEIERLIKKIEESLASGNLKLSPVDYKALTDSLKQAKERVIKLNPFKALGSAFDSYIKATAKLKTAEEENLSDKEITNLKLQAQTAAEQMAESFAAITQTIGSVGDSLSSLASSFGDEDLADTISGVTDVMSGAGQTAQGVAQIMSGDLLGGITSCVSGITSVIGTFNKMHDKKHEKRIQKMQEQIDKLADSYDNLSDAISRAYSTDKASMLKEQNKNLERQNELIKKQIQEEKKKKSTDEDKIKEWEEQIAENEKQIAENAKYNIIEAIMGTEVATAIDDLATAYADAWASGEKAAAKSANVVKNLIKTAIIEQLRNKLKPQVEEFMKFLADAMEDGVISEAEERLLERYEDIMEDTADSYLSKNAKWLADDEDESNDALTGAVRSMSEETGSVIAGRLNAFIINQGEQTSIMREQLLRQSEIARNTALSAERLQNIESTLKRIETKDNSLLSQGIS